jgi:hypothetical protein
MTIAGVWVGRGVFAGDVATDLSAEAGLSLVSGAASSSPHAPISGTSTVIITGKAIQFLHVRVLPVARIGCLSSVEGLLPLAGDPIHI